MKGFEGQFEKIEYSKDKEDDNELDLDEVVKRYAEKLRAEIYELKEKEADPHLKNINPEDLTYEDIMIYDKAKKYKLDKYEFQTYTEGLKIYFDEQRAKKMKEKVDELKNRLNKEEISFEDYDKEFRQLLQQEDKERSESGRDYISASQQNSRASFAAMIRNKLIEEEDISRHPGNPMAK